MSLGLLSDVRKSPAKSGFFIGAHHELSRLYMAGSDGYLRPFLVGCCGNCLEVFVSKETGGPAFPYSGIHKGDDASYIIDSHGMTLRDHFAGQALPDLIAGYSRNQGSGPYLDASPDEIAYWAYRYADAMLKARSSTE